MTPEESQLLSGLIERVRQTPVQDKDADADRMIRDLVAAKPDATYILAQAVLISDFAIRRSQAQIAELQRQLEEAHNAAPKSGGFLSGLFGSSHPPAPQPVQQAQPSQQPSPWVRPANPAATPSYAQPGYAPPNYAPPPNYAQPGYAQPPLQPGQSSGFLRSAAQTAVGVAGGALLFEGIESMFSPHQGFGGGFGGGGFGGGGFGGGFGAGGMGGPEEIVNETIVNNYDAPPDGLGGGNYDPGAGADPGYSDTSFDPGVDPGLDTGGDFGGGDDWT